MASMKVHRERVYKPDLKSELIERLERMGVANIGGLPLRRALLAELQSEYYHQRQLRIERRQRDEREARQAEQQERRRPVQMRLVPA